MQALGFLSGAVDGAFRGGAAGLACGPAAEVCSPVLAVGGALVEGIAGAQIAGAAADATSAGIFQSDNGGAKGGDSGGFANKRTLQTTKIKDYRVSVDAERGGGGEWNVHVKINGDKVYITKPGDLRGLPGSVRRSEAVQKAVQEAFDYIQKATE